MRVLASLAAALVLAGGAAVAGASPAAASSGGCDPYIDGTVVVVPCTSAGSTGAGTGIGGGGGAATVTSTCTFAAVSSAQAHRLGLAWPPPAGQHWAIMTCSDGYPDRGPQAVLISNATGAPVVTAQELQAQAAGELSIPALVPSTAPPRGSAGLVGLAEWFWVPAKDWHARTVTVTAGPVWATVTAVPVRLSVTPGTGLPAVSCIGPGTAYSRREPAADQHPDCSYTYLRPSAGLPGNAYQASVWVSWRVSWTGSDGAGGLLDAALEVPSALSIPVAQAEALVTSP